MCLRRIIDPPAVLLLPPATNEWNRQAVAMLREVVAKPTLHARRSLIRRVVFDPRTLHVDHLFIFHLQIDLTANTAVGTYAAHGSIEYWQLCRHGAHAVSITRRGVVIVIECAVREVRCGIVAVAAQALRDIAVMAAIAVRGPVRWAREGQDVVNGARWTDANAFTAPRASRVFRVAIRADDDLRMIATVGDVEHADDLDVLARTHTSRAENARRHVMLDDGVAIPLVAGAKRHARSSRGGHVIAMHERLELVASARVRDVFRGIALEQHRQYPAAIPDGVV